MKFFILFKSADVNSVLSYPELALGFMYKLEVDRFIKTKNRF